MKALQMAGYREHATVELGARDLVRLAPDPGPASAAGATPKP